MTVSSRTFSEAWHRVADLQVTLRHAVVMRKQLFQGETWYLLQDPFNNRFYRIRPECREFIVRLGEGRTVAMVWEECLELDPERAPGQDEVIELLAQLYHASLLHCDLPPDSSKLFERYRHRRLKELRSRWSQVMFFRIPLFDPEKLLRNGMPLVKFLTGRLAVLVWCVTLMFAVKAVVEHFPRLREEMDSLLAFDNLMLLYLGLLIVKALHEFGHTLVCKRFGGEVHTIGVMLIVFAPLPYMDATSSWALRNRWQRILVASSGMLFEFFAAACAALVWANTGPGIVHGLAFNMMVVASVSTLLFNLNPLLRFDGYYILSDLVEMPNLQTRSFALIKDMAKRYLLGINTIASPEPDRQDAFWLTVYGLTSGVYRVIVFGGIILFVADRFLLAGLLMATVCLLLWVAVPALRFASFMASDPLLNRSRPRALAVVATAVAVTTLFVSLVPLPSRFAAPGVVEAVRLLRVVNDASGQVVEIITGNGSRVVQGAPLIRLHNPGLSLEIDETKAQLDEVGALQQQSFTQYGDTARQLLEKRRAALERRLQKLVTDREALLITAKTDGVWIAPESRSLPGAWLERGTELGQIIADDQFRFVAVISQEEAASLFDKVDATDAKVRLRGQGSVDLDIARHDVIPYQHDRLPSATLGMMQDGDIPVVETDQDGVRTVEPFFKINATMESSPDAVIYHGHSGRIRYQLPAEPLLSQLLRKTRQFFQRRYQL